MPTHSGERVFTSWKEIAAFFGKGVRTVQRWERKFGLPISRPTLAKNVVLATEMELREWIHRASTQLAADNHGNGDQEGTVEHVRELAERLKRLEEDTARLARVLADFADRIDRMTLPAMPLGKGNGDGIARTRILKTELAARKS